MPIHKRSFDAFSNAILFYEDFGEHKNNWTRSIHASLQDQNFDEVPFRVPQLLEPSVLDEVGRLNGLTAEDIETYSYQLKGPVATLKWLQDMRKWATPVQRLNLAACLSATCRYHAAHNILEEVDYKALYTDQKVAYHITKFIIDNRLDRTSLHQSDFCKLKTIIETERVGPDRILDVSAQAIVWAIKADVIEPSLLDWFVKAGNSAAEKLSHTKSGREMIALSSFYRAYAMLPAAERNISDTRRYMELAEQYADEAGPDASEMSLRDARKTVLESKLKEMLYVVEDPEQARQAGKELISLDPNWSISYHELADVEISDGNVEEALRLFQKALSVGLPRLAYSQYMIGACLQVLGRADEAIDAFMKTLDMDGSNISAGISGLRLAESHSTENISFFKSYVEKWNYDGLLSPENRSMLG